MKHLKLYEYYNIEDEFFNKGDLVVLTKSSIDTIHNNFIVGNIYEITIVDEDEKEDLPYEIGEIGVGYGAWVKDEQIRKATQLEIDSVKYNL